MGRPLNELFDRPKPKISWNLSRGKARRGPQTLVRPVRLYSCCVPSPRASQVLMTLDNVMIAIAATMPAPAKNLRGRDIPKHAAEPPAEGTAGRYQHAQNHRAQYH